MVQRLAYRDGQCGNKLNLTFVAVKRPARRQRDGALVVALVTLVGTLTPYGDHLGVKSISGVIIRQYAATNLAQFSTSVRLSTSPGVCI